MGDWTVEERNGTWGVVGWGLWWPCRSRSDADRAAKLLEKVGDIATDVTLE